MPDQPFSDEEITAAAAFIEARVQRALKAAKEADERNVDIFNHAIERFNPPDHDDISIEGMIDEAADYIEKQPCHCTEAVGLDCLRCKVLGRLNDKPIAR